MTLQFITSRLPLLRKIARQVILLAVIIAISGAPAYVTQGVAWWQMSQESGGFAEAMFAAAPCTVCDFARKMSRDSEDTREFPVPAERIQSIQLAATILDPLSVPATRPADTERDELPARSIIPPGSRNDRPLTPPPQARA